MDFLSASRTVWVRDWTPFSLRCRNKDEMRRRKWTKWKEFKSEKREKCSRWTDEFLLIARPTLCSVYSCDVLCGEGTGIASQANWFPSDSRKKSSSAFLLFLFFQYLVQWSLFNCIRSQHAFQLPRNKPLINQMLVCVCVKNCLSTTGRKWEYHFNTY